MSTSGIGQSVPEKGRPPQAIPSPFSRHIITCYVRYEEYKYTIYIYIYIYIYISVQAKEVSVLTCWLPRPVWWPRTKSCLWIIDTQFLFPMSPHLLSLLCKSLLIYVEFRYLMFGNVLWRHYPRGQDVPGSVCKSFDLIVYCLKKCFISKLAMVLVMAWQPHSARPISEHIQCTDA